MLIAGPVNKISLETRPSLSAATTVIPASDVVCVCRPVPKVTSPALWFVFPVAIFKEPALKILTAPLTPLDDDPLAKVTAECSF